MLYDILKTININNWYFGEITAFYAFHTGATIESYQDRQKISKTLFKYGFKPVFSGYVIQEIINLNK